MLSSEARRALPLLLMLLLLLLLLLRCAVRVPGRFAFAVIVSSVC